MKKKSTIWLVLLLAIFMLTACNSAGEKSQNEDMPAQTQEAEENEELSDENIYSLQTEREAMDYLGDELVRQNVLVQGTALVAEGEDVQDGVKKWYFAWGKNMPEKFTAERRFSVDESGQILEYDAVNDEWHVMEPYNE
ncbi:MAG: hypothetical protein Q4D65_03275 [Peptostreptococcaceae bacterium]|nr:hypothetical protein [Peptostreptococcaceae bacterium]